MTDEKVISLVEYYMPAYKLYLDWLRGCTWEILGVVSGKKNRRDGSCRFFLAKMNATKGLHVFSID